MNSVSISILQPPLNSARTFGSQQFYSNLSQFNLFEALTLMFSDDKSRLNYTRWFFSPYEELAVDRPPPTYIFQNRARWATARHVRDVWQCLERRVHYHLPVKILFKHLVISVLVGSWILKAPIGEHRHTSLTCLAGACWRRLLLGGPRSRVREIKLAPIQWGKCCSKCGHIGLSGYRVFIIFNTYFLTAGHVPCLCLLHISHTYSYCQLLCLRFQK